MRIIMLSTDRRIFEDGSAVRRRMVEYGRIFEELHIVVLTDAKDVNEMRMVPITANVFAYPTNSKLRIFSFWDSYKIAKKIIHNSKSILHNSALSAQDPFLTGLAGYLLKLRFGLPLQIQIHTDFLSPYFWSESLANKIRVILAKFLVKQADGIRVVSERIKKSLSRFNLDSEILPIFVNTRKIQNASIKADLREKYPSHDFIILMTSRLTREKNIPIAIEAIRGLTRTERRPAQNILLLIIGDGPEREALKLQITNSKLQDNVILEPWSNDLTSYYKTADLFLLTSNYEGYGMSPVEAMSAGLPVVMTDVGLAGEIVENKKSGMVVPVGDKEALTSALSKLTKKSERRKLALNAAKTALSLATKKQYLESYKNALLEILPKPKLCYVLPRYDPADSTHFAYLAGFVREISRFFNIFLIVERGGAPADGLGCRRISAVRSEIPVLRLLETKMRLLQAWILGYKTFYVHYSFFSGFIASFLGRTFYWNCGEPWKYKRNFLRDLFERLVYRRVNLVTGTEGLARQYSEHYAIPRRRIKVMPNWIDLRQATGDKRQGVKKNLERKLNIKAEQKIILFVHRLSKRKGAHHLPEILRKLTDAKNAKLNANYTKNILFLVAGGGAERENLELRIKNYGLTNKFRFLGAVPNYLLSDYYALADVFIMPSEEEGFPHVLLEAMAVGTPFVATDVGGVKDIVPKEMYNYLVKSSEIERFVSKINNLSSKNQRELRRLSSLLKNWVKKYDITSVAEQFKLILSE